MDIKEESYSPKGESECVKEEPMECDSGVKENGVLDGQNDTSSDEKPNIGEVQNTKTTSEKNETSQRAIQQLYNDPSFAIVCSFFNKFGVFLGIKPQHFTKMERLLTSFHDTGRVDRELIDLHLTLLRKLNFKSARADVWEKFLVKYCSLTPSLESECLHIERYGYLHAPAATKLAVLKSLCESQFDYNIKFKDSIMNSWKAGDLRLLPVGFDRDGLAYWYQQDAELSIRVYCEEEGDHSGGSWNLIAKSKDELEALVEKLKSSCSTAVKIEAHAKTNANGTTSSGETDLTTGEFKFSCKMGTFIDTFQDESSIKIVNKEVKTPKGRKKGATEEQTKKEHLIESKLDDSVDIPSELRPFIDRRILPRRSARNAAITHLKELTTHTKKRADKGMTGEAPKKRGRPPKKDKQPEKRQPVQAETPLESEEEESEETNEESDEEDFMLDDESERAADTSDDDFMPLSEIRKRILRKGRRSKGGHHRKKKVRGGLLDPEDMEEEEECDSGDEQVKKERKKATEETKCKKCDKSSNPEVLLLCDMCDEAWHTWCLRPMLWYVPDDDWFCPKCRHAMLVNKFESVLAALGEQLKRKAVEDKKKDIMRLRRTTLQTDRAVTRSQTAAARSRGGSRANAAAISIKSSHRRTSKRGRANARKRPTASQKKEAAAERLKREVEYIGVSLNNIIPSSMDVKENVSESSEESDVDDGERKSKKKANRRLGFRPARPAIPIALGRSKRHVAKVDYKFGAYDELIQEAMESIDEALAKPKATKDPCRPQGGAGLGKDMANIISAESKRKSSVDSSAGEDKVVEQKSKVGKSARTHRRLNDLDVDEMTESDSEEYQASENESEVSEGISDGSEEYIPSDEGKRRSSRRRRSDDDFVVSESESEYEPSRKKSKKSKSSKRGNGKTGKRSKRRGRRLSSEEDSTSEEEESEFESEESSAEDVTRRKAVAKRRWAPRASSSEDDFDEPRKTQTGRPLRKAVANAKKVEEEQEDEEDESSEGHKKNERPVCARRRRISSDEGDFEPDEEEQEEDEDEEEEADEDEHESEEEQKEHSSKSNAVTASKEHDEEPSEKESAKGKGEVEKVESQQEANAEKHDQAESSANPELQKNKKEGEAKKEIKEETEVSKSPHRESVASSHLPQVRQIKAERRLSSSSQSPGPPPITLIASVPVSYSVASTSTDANVMHPSTVIQQMARLAAPTSMARYPQPAQTAMMFPARGVLPPGVQVPISNPYAAYPPPDKVPYIAASAPNLYGVRPPAYMKPPNVPPGYGPPPPEEWNPYATAPNVFATSGASAMMMPIPPGVPAVAPGTLPVSDADSLGNALASAMDY